LKLKRNALFKDIYRGKKVLVTGHTGFKGSWLTTWLLQLGARVIGVSKDIPTSPSMFEVLRLEEKISHYISDIRDFDTFREIFENEKPDFIFHLAAQPIVSTSYENPLETITSNILGTTHILETLRLTELNVTAIIITSDKAYDNVEQVWGYKEDDKMGGKDIYSGSKGGAEIVINSYFHSFLNKSENIKIAVGRAGNVIGGGDWAKDRIVVDCVEAWSENRSVEIRSPKATRPWQHVLEPLSGYLNLGAELFERKELHGEAFNFGPRAEQNHTVLELLTDLSSGWKIEEPYKVTDNIPFHEAGLLKLNCDKALFHLKWQSTMLYENTIKFTGDWYLDFYKNKKDMFEKTTEQISEYIRLAKKQNLEWLK
jgi:CDP-glucose 4,6-dehydratase